MGDMSIETAKAEFRRARARLEHALATTPDDRLAWSPSPTARSAVAQVAHAADAIGHIHGWLSGNPFEPSTSAAADAQFREHDDRPRSREEVLELLRLKSEAFLAWLDALTPADLDRLAQVPFGLGDVPVREGIIFPARHTNDHAAQMEYMQTIYGDHDWHSGF